MAILTYLPNWTNLYHSPVRQSLLVACWGIFWRTGLFFVIFAFQTPSEILPTMTRCTSTPQRGSGRKCQWSSAGPRMRSQPWLSPHHFLILLKNRTACARPLRPNPSPAPYTSQITVFTCKKFVEWLQCWIIIYCGKKEEIKWMRVWTRIPFYFLLFLAICNFIPGLTV